GNARPYFPFHGRTEDVQGDGCGVGKSRGKTVVSGGDGQRPRADREAGAIRGTDRAGRRVDDKGAVIVSAGDAESDGGARVGPVFRLQGSDFLAVEYGEGAVFEHGSAVVVEFLRDMRGTEDDLPEVGPGPGDG